MKVVPVLRAAATGMLPFQPALRRLARAVRPYQDDPANSDYCVTHGLAQITALRQAGVVLEGSEVLEFGSGWLPIIPLLLTLAGARRVVLTDIARLMDERTMERAKEVVGGRLGDVATVLGRPVEDLAGQLRAPFAPDYLVPWDAAAHPAGSVDLVMSRAVFEHVPEPRIRSFLGQFHRILRDGGVMCHLVDNSDHWQHRQRSLSRVNFLRYEEGDWLWRLAQVNEQAYQNRLRHADYLELFRAAGFVIVAASGTADAQCLDDLRALPLASRFRGRDPRDLAILESLLVARRA